MLGAAHDVVLHTVMSRVHEKEDVRTRGPTNGIGERRDRNIGVRPLAFAVWYAGLPRFVEAHVCRQIHEKSIVGSGAACCPGHLVSKARGWYQIGELVSRDVKALSKETRGRGRRRRAASVARPAN